MDRIKQKLSLLAAFLAPLTPLAVKAQDYNYDYTTSELTEAQAGGILAGLGALLFVFVALAVIGFIFWLVMLIHALQNDIPDKNTWIIVLVVSFIVGLPLVGALVYYFMVKRKMASGAKPAQPSQQPPKSK